MQIWKLNKEAEKRRNYNHPWVFSNELSHSPKGIEAGEWIELQSSQGKFIAYGYGNPNSLIAFRVLSRDPSTPPSTELILKRLRAAHKLRQRSQVEHASHRLIFSEADGLPGLIIDRFINVKNESIFVIQPQTAGADRLINFTLEVLSVFCRSDLNLKNYEVVIAKNSSARNLEGLAVEGKLSLERTSINLRSCDIILRHKNKSLSMNANILEGQKTGFFLDQQENVNRLLRSMQSVDSKPLRILDICTYVGQWSSHIALHFKENKIETEFHLMDVSSDALALAEKNVGQFSKNIILHKQDVMQEWKNLPQNFDIIICDPPAFVKKKKDLPVGLKAYTKLNRQALKHLGDDGLYVTCSCSGLVSNEDFKKSIVKAQQQSETNLVWFFEGGHSPDHPWLLDFPQGQYLKCMAGIKSL